MKHASPAALDRLEPLLGALRQIEILNERSRGVFYLNSRAFLHFHEDPAGLFADIRVRPQAEFARVPVNDERSQATFLEIVRIATDPRR